MEDKAISALREREQQACLRSVPAKAAAFNSDRSTEVAWKA